MESAETVHLAAYPSPDERMIDSETNELMEITRKIVESAAFARQRAGIKLRWPVAEILIDTDDTKVEKAVKRFEEILIDQINVKTITMKKIEMQYIIKPNYTTIGPKYTQDAEKVVSILKNLDGKVLHDALEKGTFEIDGFTITEEDVEFEMRPPPGYVVVESDIGMVFLDTRIDEALKKEAYTREIVRRIQEMRKEMDLNIEEYITTSLQCTFDLDETYIKKETRSESLERGEGKGYHKKWVVDSEEVEIWIDT